MLFSLGSVAWADDTGIVPFSSDYLEGHSVYLRSSKTGRMAVDVTVEAIDIADIVGIHGIYIEYQVNGRWKFYDTLDSIDYPEFYMYDSPDYTNTIVPLS